MKNDAVVQQWITELLSRIVGGVDKATDFMASELPLFVAEFLKFATIYHWSIVFMSGVLLIGIGCVIYRIVRWDIWGTHSYNFPTGIPSVMVGIGGTLIASSIFIGLFLEHLTKAIMVTWAPRLYLIKEFLGWIK